MLQRKTSGKLTAWVACALKFLIFVGLSLQWRTVKNTHLGTYVTLQHTQKHGIVLKVMHSMVIFPY